VLANNEAGGVDGLISKSAVSCCINIHILEIITHVHKVRQESGELIKKLAPSDRPIDIDKLQKNYREKNHQSSLATQISLP